MIRTLPANGRLHRVEPYPLAFDGRARLDSTPGTMVAARVSLAALRANPNPHSRRAEARPPEARHSAPTSARDSLQLEEPLVSAANRLRPDCGQSQTPGGL